jgi:spore coat polysaccharide biosynthesis protein SpsF
VNVARGTAVLCVVQARTGSTRLPGKVLRQLGEVSMLEFLLRRLERFGPPASVPTWSSLGVVVATTDGAADNAIVEVAERCGVGVVRGDEFDVLGRFSRVVNDYAADHVVRITADCPLTDPLIVEAVVTKHLERGAHYTTNVLPRTFPKGLDVEVIDCVELLEANRLARDAVEREHVTPFLYRRPERYVLANLRSGRALGHLRWTVDTADDLEAVRAIVRRLAAHGIDWRTASWLDVLGLVGASAPHPTASVVTLRPATINDAARVLAWRNDAEAVRWSTRSGGVDRAEHERWFAAILDDPGYRMMIAEFDGDAIGSVRVDVNDGIGVVSIVIDPEWRGRGYGRAVLHALEDELAADCQVRGLEAVVHPGNERSLRAFEANGFAEVAAARDDGMRVLRRAS